MEDRFQDSRYSDTQFPNKNQLVSVSRRPFRRPNSRPPSVYYDLLPNPSPEITNQTIPRHITQNVSETRSINQIQSAKLRDIEKDTEMNKSVQFSLTYWAAEHPAVTRFRWDHSAWGSTWTFVAVSLFTYLVFLAICRAIAAILKKGISLGKFASAYSVALALIRCLILLGCVEATLAETKDMWRLWARLRRLQNTSRLRAGIEWAICFPLGTRSAGPVFFWSYVFYLTTYLELAETLISVVRKERVAASDVLHKITAVVACFCWLEFTQSMQILGMAVHTLNTVFRMGNLRGICDGCKTVTLVMASVWLLCLHFRRGGCNGLESWALGTFGYVVSGCLRFTNKQKERTS